MANIVFDYSVTNLNSKTDGVSTHTYKDIGTSNIRFTTKDGVKYINDSNTSNIDAEAVKVSLNNIFNFYQGQRILEMEFGNTLHKYFYSTINDYSANLIGATIRSMIANYEPRIVITDIEIVPNDNECAYYIILKYKLPDLEMELTSTVSMSNTNGISVS